MFPVITYFINYNGVIFGEKFCPAFKMHMTDYSDIAHKILFWVPLCLSKQYCMQAGLTTCTNSTLHCGCHYCHTLLQFRHFIKKKSLILLSLSHHARTLTGSCVCVNCVTLAWWRRFASAVQAIQSDTDLMILLTATGSLSAALVRLMWRNVEQLRIRSAPKFLAMLTSSWARRRCSSRYGVVSCLFLINCGTDWCCRSTAVGRKLLKNLRFQWTLHSGYLWK